MTIKEIELKPIEESQGDYDRLQDRIRKFFMEVIYYPLIKELGLSKKVIKNAAHPNPLMDALYKGRVTYSAGAFRGQFSAGITKELKYLGAVFDRKTSSFKLPEEKIPTQIKQLIASSDRHFQERMKKIDEKLAKLIPEDLAKEFHCADLFDRSLYEADESFRKNVKNITVSPTLTPEQRKKIATEWQDNLRLSIQGWTDDQIKDLRAKIYEQVTSGGRRESLISPILKVTRTIQESHEQALNKAKFLAHQESRLMMATFKQVRYEQAGSKSYKWRCVHRPHDMDPKHHTLGNVRYSHGLLDGKEFLWSDPPVTTNPGQPVRRNHPGQDYRCRCFPRAIIRREEK